MQTESRTGQKYPNTAGTRTVAEYVNNGDDLRVKKTVRKSDSAYAAEVTYFVCDRQHVILETDGSGNTTTRYIRGINYVAQYSKVTGGGSSGTGGGISTSGEIQNWSQARIRTGMSNFGKAVLHKRVRD